MKYYLHHRGEFLSVSGVRWSVEILLTTPPEGWPNSQAKRLEFDADPLTIEWGEESKEVPICGSTATVNLVSPGDRSYVYLYTENPKGVRMDVYRNNELYWIGCLDPEFYEEPYSSGKDYTVSLTFSDFGALDRQRYALKGKQTLEAIIRMALDEAGIQYRDIVTGMISGSASGESLLSLSVDSANFYDEDKEAMSLREVLGGILQPLALRMVQRSGQVWIYDLNALYGAVQVPIEWDSTDQMLSVDKVFNNAKVTWSPYVVDDDLSGDGKVWVKSSKFTDEQAKQSLNSVLPTPLADGTELFAFHYSKDLRQWGEEADLGFVMLTNSEGKGAKLHESVHRFYKMLPFEDGQESEGVALRWLTVSNAHSVIDGKEIAFTYKPWGVAPTWGSGGVTAGAPMITFSAIDLPAVSEESEQNLRVKVNLLIDPRYNPYEEAAGPSPFGYTAIVDYYKSAANFIYVPVAIKFQPSGSDEVYVWTNRGVVEQVPSVRVINSLDQTKGEWVTYDGATTYGYLCWYDASKRDSESGVVGWKSNRPAINPHTQPLLSSLEKAEEGQVIPYPAEAKNGGKLWVEVLEGPWIVKDGSNSAGGISAEPSFEEVYFRNLTTWVLMELPEITAENNSTFNPKLDTDDVEYTGVLNSSAREDIEIDTICGTSADGVTMARGAYYLPDGSQVKEITRAGKTGQAENLLIGTLYSQFGSRKTKLTGTAVMKGEGVVTYTDRSSEGVVFMMVGVVESPREDTVSGTYVEVRPDEYEEV